MPSELESGGYHDGFNSKLFNILPPNRRKVLELGCGTGRLGQYYKHVNPKSVWHAVEFNQNAAVVARTRIDKVWVDDINCLDEVEVDDDYDLIVMGDILEHLMEPENTVKILTKKSKDDACLCICTPNAGHIEIVKRVLCGDFSYDDEGLLDRTHRRLFSRSSLFKLLLDQHWLPHQCDEYTSTLQNDYLTKIIMQACEHLGLPKLTAVKNLSQIQNVVIASKHRPTETQITDSTISLAVIVARNRSWQFDLNIRKSTGLIQSNCNVIYVDNARNANEAFEIGKSLCSEKWLVFAHQDVYFPTGSLESIRANLSLIEMNGNLDTPIGFAGLALEPGPDRRPRPSGLLIDIDKLFDHPRSSSAISIDECCVILHRDTKLRIDPALGWHLWATDLCIQAEYLHGSPCGKILRAPLFHNSVSDGSLPESFRDSLKILMNKYPSVQKFSSLYGSFNRPKEQLASTPAQYKNK